MLNQTRVYAALLISVPALRSRCIPPLTAGCLATVVVGLPAALSLQLGASEHVTMLRMVAAILALGAAFLLNDAAARTTAVVATSRSVQYAAWLTQGILISATWWAAALTITRADAGRDLWAMIPAAGLTLEAVTLFTTAVAAAAWLRSISQGRPGFLAGPALLAIVAAMAFLPQQASLFTEPGDSRWAAMHRIWAALWTGSLLILWLASREPASRRWPASRQGWVPSCERSGR